MTQASPLSIWSLLRRLIGYAPRLYWIDTLLWLLIAGLPALPGLVIREFFNGLTNAPQRGVLPVRIWVVLFLAIGLARVVVIILGRITKTQHRFTINALVMRNLLAQIYDRPGSAPLINADPGATGSRSTLSPGEVISFFREDAAQIEDNVVGSNEVLGEGIFAIGSLLLLLSINARITLFVFLPLLMIAGILHQTSDRIKRYRRASRQATQQVTGMIGELFSSVQAIQVAGAETTVLRQLRQLSDRRSQAMVRDQLLSQILDSSFENLVNLGTGAILLVAAQAIPSETGRLQVGDLALFVYYLGFVTYFLAFLGDFLALTKQSEVSFERMQGLVAGNVAALVAPQPLYLPDLTGRQADLPSPLQLMPEQSTIAADRLETLRIENLGYHYPQSDRGIETISFTLHRGSLTVITGEMGAGKTTLLRTVLGLLPSESGQVFWNGVAIPDPAHFWIPPRSAYTPQVPQLLSTTLRENVLLGLTNSDEQVMQALGLACFDRDLLQMPEGLNTLVGSQGMRLSGGQIQRLAVARMLLRQPELLVFDDVSSALDWETEQALWARLLQPDRLNLTWQPTCLVVSHRRSVLEKADQVLVLRQGRITQMGRFHDLQIV